MLIRYRKNGLGYKFGDIKDLPEKKARELIMKGIAMPYTKKSPEEIKNDILNDFNKRYKKIVLLHNSSKKCIYENEEIKELYLKYEKLPIRLQRSLFIPYLVEKADLGIADNNDMSEISKLQKELEEKNIKDFKEDYTEGVTYLHALGLTDLMDKNNFSKSFDKYSTYSREEIEKSKKDYYDIAFGKIIIVK